MRTKLVITLTVLPNTIAADVISAVQRGRNDAEVEAVITALLRDEYAESGVAGIVVERVQVITPS